MTLWESYARGLTPADEYWLESRRESPPMEGTRPTAWGLPADLSHEEVVEAMRARFVAQHGDRPNW